MRLTYFGHSCWGVEVADERIVIDPYTPTAEGAAGVREYAQGAQLLLTTHGAPDHFGATLELLRANAGLDLVSEPAVARHVRNQGVEPRRVQAMVWNQWRRFGRTCVDRP